MKQLTFAALVVFVSLSSNPRGSEYLTPRREDPGIMATVTYVQKLQTKDGGFLPRTAKAGEKLQPGLRATSAGVRTLRYLGVEVPNKDACVKFVESCHDPESGGFADIPQGKSDVFSTAVGMMAVVELKMPVEKYGPGAVKYLSENAKNFEEIRIAVAGLETLTEPLPKRDAWLEAVRKLENSDGTFGKDLAQPRMTGGAAVAILRLKGKLTNPEAILKTLSEGQRRNGGYGKEDSEIASDLETSYRIMRCFHMLKAKPANVEGMRSFVAKCRNEDGGYSVTAGGESSLSGTYYAVTIRHWLDAK